VVLVAAACYLGHLKNFFTDYSAPGIHPLKLLAQITRPSTSFPHSAHFHPDLSFPHSLLKLSYVVYNPSQRILVLIWATVHLEGQIVLAVVEFEDLPVVLTVI